MRRLRRLRGAWWLAALAIWGCASAQSEPRPFFQAEQELGSHGRKTWLDRLVETDPSGLSVEVAPEYLNDPPARIAVLPFSDEGSAQRIINKIPVTFRNQQQRAEWAWTDANRLRKSLIGALAQREFIVVNPIRIDSVLADHGITDAGKLDSVSPRLLGEWLGADALVYGEVVSYESYYAFLTAAWRVGVRARMISARDGHPLIVASGSRYDVTLMPALDPLDMGINSGLAALELRDINLARAEEEVGRELVMRIPESDKLRAQLIEEGGSGADRESRATPADLQIVGTSAK